MFSIEELISGERIQSLADVYIGLPHLFNANPNINISKCLNIQSINTPFKNPPIIFLYPDIIVLFLNKLSFFKRPFVLITHNSDIGIISHEIVNYILQNPYIIRWFAQNVCFSHPKLHPIPIGFANRQWPHGSISSLHSIIEKTWSIENTGIEKELDIYLCFNLKTAPHNREKCKEICESKGIPFLQTLPFEENMKRLSKYKYCICPEGNGVDTHRIWECLYVKTVPILLNTPFSKILVEYYKLPVIVIESWEVLNCNELPPYSQFDFEESMNLFKLSSIKNNIIR